MNFVSAARRRRASAPGLALTSMIDVIFLLLIYFIVSSTYTPPEAELTPAIRTERDSAGRAAEFTPQVVDVLPGRDGAVFRVGARTVADARSLAGLLSGLPRDPGVIVRGDNEAPTEGVFAALQACRDAGFEKVTYVPAK